MKNASSLAKELKKHRAIYLDKCKEKGGTAEGFRQYIARLFLGTTIENQRKGQMSTKKP